MKVAIFDSGTIINFSLNGFLYLFENLKKFSEVRFIITPDVKYEIIDRPIENPRFELEAIRIKNLLKNGVIEMSSALEISDKKLNEVTKKLMKIANRSVSVKGKFIEIVSSAEISCLALSSELSKKKVNNLVVMDERTTRLLAEEPESLERLISSKIHQKVSVNIRDLKVFSSFKFIRSTELIYVAYKKGLLELNDPKALEAALYATKFRGASVSFEEIDIIKKYK